MELEVITDKEILLDRLVDTIKKYLKPTTVAKVCAAYHFGKEAHKKQFRKNGDPYIYHPLAVALILANLRMDSRTLIAAILHDVIEDTDYSHQDISEKFGEDVADMVEGVSKISQMTKDDKVHSEAASFRKMLMAMTKDVRVMLIKLADRLHNMHTLEHLRPEKQYRIAKQTMEIYAPIANRLGMRSIAADLEDLSFKITHPKRYKAILETVSQEIRGRKPIADDIRLKLEEAIDKANIANATLKARKKNIYSIYLKYKNRGVAFKQQQDIYGVRIVVGSRDDCYRTLGLVHATFPPKSKSVKDYIATPKSNGYQSLHTIVIGPFGAEVEVQIRTEQMDRMAETGIASHWLYKSDRGNPEKPQRLLKEWLDGFLQSHAESDSGEDGEYFMEHLRAEMFPDKLFVFTPKGAIKRLPVGATTIDFAYAVHSDVGNHCVGSQIDGEMAPLNRKLESGQKVKILTNRSAHPQNTWLNFAKTGKARAQIRHYLKNQQSKEAIQIGKRTLTKALREVGFEGKRIPSDDKIKLMQIFEIEDWNNLLHDIGVGKRLPIVVAQQLISFTNFDSKLPEEATPKTALSIRGAEHMLINYAKCCYPVPGDQIIGTFGTGKGLVVHRTKCPNSKKFRKQLDRWLQIEWSRNQGEQFHARITLETSHTPGVLAIVSNIIAKQEANILNVDISSTDPVCAHMDVLVEIRSKKQLRRIANKLRKHKAVYKVERPLGS